MDPGKENSEDQTPGPGRAGPEPSAKKGPLRARPPLAFPFFLEAVRLGGLTVRETRGIDEHLHFLNIPEVAIPGPEAPVHATPMGRITLTSWN